MLKKSLSAPLRWAIAISLMSFGVIGSAEAALFDQQEVEAERFVAIAVPLPQGDRYNLIVLEQQSDVRPCWEEDAETGKIDPLLLKFDFSGICGRSADSNGYSIRQVGEDLALKYRLSLQKQGSLLKLMGLPLESSVGKPIEIGRAQIQGEDEFLKIELNSDWKFTRRVYQGQALGHIYFTRDVIPPEPVAEELESTTADVAVLPETAEVSAAQPEEGNEDTKPGETLTASVVQPFDRPIQIYVPTPPSRSPVSSAPFLNTVRPVSDVDRSPVGVIPVPEIAPLGRVGASEPDVFSSLDLARLPQGAPLDADAPPPPPVQVAISVRRYRVYVNPSDAQQSEAAINALAPDAFWTFYNGSRMLQVGSYLEQGKADVMIQALAQQGINATIDASQY